jgi:DNA-binding beta-propeller fold protein YncE
MVLLTTMPLASAGDRAALRLVETIALSDIDGRLDHFAIDTKGQRAFLAALSHNTIEVVDLKAGQVVRSLPGFAKPQGVRFVAELDRLYVASGADGTLKTFDGATLSLIRTDVVSLGADAIGFDPDSKYLYVGSGGTDARKETGDLTVFSAASGAQVAAIVTDAHAGQSVVGQLDGRIYVLVPEKAEVLVLDRGTRVQIAKWTVPEIQKCVALDLDEPNHRLFLGVRSPASIVVLDSKTGAVVASIPTVGMLDGLSYDRASHRIYTSGGEGSVDVTQQLDADHYDRIARISTRSNARTSLFVPEWRRLYVALPRDQDHGAELRVFEVLP